MHKMLTILCAAALALAVAMPTAYATGLRAGAAYWDAGDFSDTIDDSLLGAEIVLALDIATPVGLELRAAALGTWDDGKRFSPNGSRYEYDFTGGVVPLEAGLSMEIPAGILTLYGSVGIGWYWFYAENDIDVRHGSNHADWRSDDNWDENDNTFGAYGSAGLRISLLPTLSLYGQAQYRHMFDKIELDLGDPLANAYYKKGYSELDASGLAISAGVCLNF